MSLVKHSPELFHLVLDHLCGRLLPNERVGATETIPEVVNLTSFGCLCRGATRAMPSLLNELTKPGCIRLGNQWGHCGVYYVEPTGGLQQTKRE